MKGHMGKLLMDTRGWEHPSHGSSLTAVKETGTSDLQVEKTEFCSQLSVRWEEEPELRMRTRLCDTLSRDPIHTGPGFMTKEL